jgi:hypothetical protein
MCAGAQRRGKGREYDNGDGVTRQLKPQHRGNMRCGVLYINAEKYGSSATGNTTKYKLNKQLMLQVISMLKHSHLPLYPGIRGGNGSSEPGTSLRSVEILARMTNGQLQQTVMIYALYMFLHVRYLGTAVMTLEMR